MAAVIGWVGLATGELVRGQTISTESKVLDFSKLPDNSTADHARSFRQAMSDYFAGIEASMAMVIKAKAAFENASTPEHEAALYNTVASALVSEKNALETIIAMGTPLDEQIEGMRDTMLGTMNSIDRERVEREQEALVNDRKAAQHDREILNAAQTFSSILDGTDSIPWDARLAVAIADAGSATAKRMARNERIVARNADKRKEQYRRKIAALEGYHAQVGAAISISHMRIVELQGNATLMLAECQHARLDRGVDMLVTRLGNLGPDIESLRKNPTDWEVPGVPETEPAIVDDGDAAIKERLRRALAESRMTAVSRRDDSANEPLPTHDQSEEEKR